MSETGLQISKEGVVEYVERPLAVTGSVRRTRGFRMHIDDIRIIAVSPILLLDDEALIITLVDKHERLGHFSSLELETEAVDTLEKSFGVDFKKAWYRYSYAAHTKLITQIVFPQIAEGAPLFEGFFDSVFGFVRNLKRATGMTMVYNGMLNQQSKTLDLRENK